MSNFMTDVVAFVQRMNLSYPQSVVGAYFNEIISFLAVIFGLSFLLFSWKHHNFYMGFVGIITGCWLGILLKGLYSPDGRIAPFLYIVICALACLFISIHFKKLMGILLGGFTAACLSYVLFPALFEPGKNRYVAVSLAFLFGGGFGAVSPRFFFILNSSLIGSVFVTYGLSTILFPSVIDVPTSLPMIFVHLVIFLPLLIFGVMYQLSVSKGDEGEDGEPDKEKGKAEKKPSPAAA